MVTYIVANAVVVETGSSDFYKSEQFTDAKFTDNELYRSILFDKLNINEGMLMENVVALMLRHKRERLYFYSRNDNKDRSKQMKIDFFDYRREEDFSNKSEIW